MDSPSQEDHIRSYLSQLHTLTSAEIAFFKTDLKVTSYSKKEFFLKEGEVQKAMGFISEGLIRRYYVNQKGNEITTGFNKENEYITDYPAFIRQKPTKYFMQCLEPSTVVNLPYKVIHEAYEKFDKGQLYGRLMAEQTLTTLNDRIEGFLFHTAEERYLKFVEENSDLINRISLTHLSSFLGIERQSLSRIRKRIAGK